VQKIPSGRRWAAQLGMLTFAIGICTQQWHIAVMGIVYSWITAAAMWQNFRAHLPFLYDPWGETLPKPPTLMHAMIAISILIEVGAIVAGISIGVLGRDNLAIAQAFGYAVCAVGVMIGMTHFLSNREVTADQVWLWKPDVVPNPNAGKYDWLYAPPPEPFFKRYGLLDIQLIPDMLMGAAGGLALGMLARGYQLLLLHLPATQEIMHKAQQSMAENPDLRYSYFVMAVFFAPFAEEFLFRGLLFRALDREWQGKWHGWLPVLASAAFFAIYHQPLAWLPVGLLGVTNAWLFKKTGKLYPCVLLHMIYNAVVLS
jgi:membrane protease YdiL (CAAX protease family)